MTTQRKNTPVKIPVFDKENFGQWKKKILLYLKVSNPKYLVVLKKGPIVPMVIELQKEEDGVVTPARHYVKDIKEYTADEKLDAALDVSLQLILIDSLDPTMYSHVVNCVDSKHIWETIETINEGTDEVRENRMEILMSEYEHFQAGESEGISDVFERYNKLINSLNLAGKFYSIREINRKFLLTMPAHLEHRITAIRESRDLDAVSLERLYGILKTYELEQEQQKEMRSKREVTSTSAALYGTDPVVLRKAPRKKEAEIVRSHSSDMEQITVEHGQTKRSGQSNSEYYSLEELDQLEDEDMALVVRKFGKFRFRRNPSFRYKSNNRFQRGSFEPSGSTRDDYKTGAVDRSRFRCFNCNEIGHFASNCKKPMQATRPNFEQPNQKNKQEKAHVAKGKTWDDTDSDEEDHINFVLVVVG